ncbi:MAG TPA: hypothetical protein DD745_00680 [Bacteroidales bacterium]|nr:MAG: hypothetical protein A2X06_15660 [Bacteroidetes bacterium GWC2_40_22]HBQ81384.1 hypothetical protein [Bacteroidales bacterium]
MPRFIFIILLLFLFSGLNGQKQDSLKQSVKTIQKQDSVKSNLRGSQKLPASGVKTKVAQTPDSVRFSPNLPPGSAKINKVTIVSAKQGLIKISGKEPRKLDSAKVFIKILRVPGQVVRKPRIIYPPDAIRFAPEIPPERIKPVPVNVVSKMQGLLRKPIKGFQKRDSVKVYIKVLRKQDATAFLTYVAPGEPPVNSLVLIPAKQELIEPQWYIVQQKTALEAKRLAALVKQDSARAPKPRILKQWNLSKDFSEEILSEFDTVFSLFNRYRISDAYSPVNANLGNYGLPYYSVNFFNRINDPDRYLYYNHYRFMHNPENALFMNTQVPFTELKWVLSGEKEVAEQTFRVKHSQNINRFLNFGLVYDIIFSLGQYSNQRSEDKTFTFYTSYTRSKYKLYFSTGLNGLFGQENGGITDKSELDIEIANTKDIPVNLGSLNDASSFLRNRNFLVVQKYTFLGAIPDKDTIPVLNPVVAPLTGTFSHIFQLDYSRRMYRDASPGSGFYDSIYMNRNVTFDSLSAKFVKNTFRFDFTTDETKVVGFRAGFGLRNENFWFGQLIPGDSLTKTDTANWFRGNNVLLGSFSNQIGNKFRWQINGELYFDRYRQGDYILNGEMARSFDLKKGGLEWLITGGINKRTPSFWYTHWGGNNFKWSFDAEKESRLDLGTRISYPARHADLKLNYAVISNYLDFDTLALPSQDTSQIRVLSLWIRKDFKAWKFHLVPDVIIQKSSNPDIIDLPMATVKVAAYFEHLFRFEKTNGRLNTQFGVDVTYHTLYHPYSYMPATGRFYRQDQSESGNYPFINAFLNIKLKRTRIFLMFDHINYGLMSGEMLYNYELVPFYPQPGRRFAFGLAWTFYN